MLDDLGAGTRTASRRRGLGIRLPVRGCMEAVMAMERSLWGWRGRGCRGGVWALAGGWGGWRFSTAGGLRGLEPGDWIEFEGLVAVVWGLE